MRRVLLFLILGVALVAVAWALANLPGHVTASIGSFTIETSAGFAILALVVLFGLVLLLLRMLGFVAGLPQASAGWQRRRRLELGEKAVTRALVALAASDQWDARRESRKARQLLGASPRTLQLIAEAGRLSGREDEAEEAFKALTKYDEAKFLGLRGLLRQAIDRHDWNKADAIAREAEAARPGALWLRQQRAELALHTDNWAEAAELSSLDRPRASYLVAAADAEADPVRSVKLAKQAWKEDGAFSPAVLSYAHRLRSSGRESRAQAVVAEAWKRAPHPELADFAVGAGDTKPLTRFQMAKRLVAKNPAHAESRLLLGRLAMEAGLTGEARHQADAARAEGVNQRRLWLLIAELDEKERGDTEVGRASQRDALRRAALADPDPAWQCERCRLQFPKWSARCSSCGAVGMLRWQSGPRAQIVSLPVVSLPVVA